MYVLSAGTLAAAALAVFAAQVAFAVPAVLNGLFQQDLGPTSSQLTWISDAFIVPVALLELTFGVLGDLFGRKRLLVGGALLLAIGEAVAVLTPGAGSSTGPGCSCCGPVRSSPGSVQPRCSRPAWPWWPRARTRPAPAPGPSRSGRRRWPGRPDLAGARRPDDQDRFRHRSQRQLALDVRRGARPCAGQRGGLAGRGPELRRAGGAVAGLAGPGHGRDRAVRAAVRGDPGSHQRLGQWPGRRGLRRRRRLPGAVHPGPSAGRRRRCCGWTSSRTARSP